MRDVYGIDEDYRSISDVGIIRLLMRTGYLTDCGKTQRLLDRITVVPTDPYEHAETKSVC